jgi:pilus assembly protein TadC
MSFKVIFLEEFGKAFVPKKINPVLRAYMRKAGFDEVPYKLFGGMFYISAFLTTLIFIAFIFPYLNQNQFSVFLISIFAFLGWFLIQLAIVALFFTFTYFFLDLKIYRRTKKMEEQFPDFLQVLSSNLKGGMTFEKALWSSIKPRFDVLAVEMAKTSKQVMTGYDIGQALIDLSERYDSLMLRRTVDLMVSEVESGGNVAKLLDRIVDKLKETKELKDQMVADAIAYVIFISVIVIFISPLLFALSFNLLKVLINFTEKLSSSTASVSSLPFSFGKVNVKVSDFRIFSLMALTTIAFFSSLIVSIVEKGDMKGGLKYIPIYLIGSLGFYLLFMRIFSSVFGSIL